MVYTLGIDIGSTTSKCCLIDENREIVGTSLIKSGTGTRGPEKAMEAIEKESGIKKEDIAKIIVTGYGRKNFDGDGDMSELSCHAKGMKFLFPDVRTIIDIGGQDSKVMKLSEDGKLLTFLMNDKCAAGTGRFLDVMAGILGMDIDELSETALLSDTPAKISSTCTVFAESEVISRLSSGTAIPDLVAGICESVATKVSSLVKRVGVMEKVCMSGGVAKNAGVRRAIENNLDIKLYHSELSQLAGALGAALSAMDKYEKENA